MITLKNTQRTHKINKARILKTVLHILDQLDYADFDISIWLTNSATIRRYNRDFRKKDKATDILSFPYHENLKPPKRIKPSCEEDKNIGDIIIAVDFVVKLLPLYSVTLDQRLDTLLIHGICHLLGYTHYDPDNDKQMIAIEKKLARSLKINT